MNRNSLIIVAAIAVLLIVAAAVSVNKREEGVAPEEAVEVQLLPPDTADRMKDAARIVIDQAEETVTLEKAEDGRWTVEENEGFWANEEKIRLILTGFGRFEPLERKTGNPDLYEKLGVNDPEEDGSSGIRVTVADAGGDEIVEAILGRVQSGSQGLQKRYMRVPGNEHAWLVQTPLDASGGKNNFTFRQIIDIEPDRWASFNVDTWKEPEVISADKPTSDSTDWIVADIPEDKEISSQTSLNSFVRPFQRMNHAGVSREVMADDSYTSESFFSGRTWDGFVLDVELRADENDDFWARFVASADETAESYSEDTLEEVERINNDLGDWMFKLSRWHSNSLTNNRDSFLKLKPADPIEAAHILVAWKGSGAEVETERTKEEAKTRADELLQQLREDPDMFAELAEFESDDAEAAQEGGFLGEFEKGLFEDSFDEAAFSLEVGEISDVVETSRGFHIIRRTK